MMQVVKLRAWAAPMLGGGVRLTAAMPGADLLLKRLLRQPLLAREAQLPQGRCCEQSSPCKRAGHACQHVQSGLVILDSTRRLICLGSGAPEPAGDMVGPLHYCTFPGCLTNFSLCSHEAPVLRMWNTGRCTILKHGVWLQPCVGIWISGILSLQDSHLWAAGMEFLLSTRGVGKALQPDMAFLVILILPGTVLPGFSVLPTHHAECKREGEAKHTILLHVLKPYHGVLYIVAGSEVVYEAAPQLLDTLRLPVWAFSARAKHAPGNAPAVVCLRQFKLLADGVVLDTGEPSQDLLIHPA